ncbi:MAG: beta-galactosidase small subunit [Roseburia sp.]
MDYTNKSLRVVYGDATLGVHGEDFSYLFSYPAAGPVSLVKDGMEWIYRAPKPCFWRATTDNDRGNGFPIRSGMWLGADLFLKNTDFYVKRDGGQAEKPITPYNNRYSEHETAETMEIGYFFETITVPVASVEVVYRVDVSGGITVNATYHGAKGLPELPEFGMRFITPSAAESYTYEGLSGETYPDRMKGGVPGIYEVEGLPVTPYLVPQECGNHMETKWVSIHKEDEQGKHSLRFSMEGTPFAFSALPYTAMELENALHMEELPPKRRTVICILGAVRGVGGIDSWGADVAEAYRISGEEDIAFSFGIVLK